MDEMFSEVYNRCGTLKNPFVEKVGWDLGNRISVSREGWHDKDPSLL